MTTDSTRFMRAARRQPVDRAPVWFMRQAGRVLPEYRLIRGTLSLMDICRSPDLCAEVTLQPVRRFRVDAAILFADIMHPLFGVGIDLEIVDGVGPVIREPVRSAADLPRLRTLMPEADLPFVLDTIRLLKAELGDATPLIGFAGAPFTLAAYLIEGKSSRDFAKTKAVMYSAPELWRSIMERLTGMVIAFMAAQRRAGVDALQLFDSWVGCLSPSDYRRYVQPYTRMIFKSLGTSGVPLIHFGVNTATLLPHMASDGASVIGVDWRVPLDDAWEIVGPSKAVQGNLDPAVLLGSPEVIDREVTDVLRRANGRAGHIFNLGHGLLPTTPISGVERALESLRRYDAAREEPVEAAAALAGAD